MGNVLLVITNALYTSAIIVAATRTLFLRQQGILHIRWYDRAISHVLPMSFVGSLVIVILSVVRTALADPAWMWASLAIAVAVEVVLTLLYAVWIFLAGTASRTSMQTSGCTLFTLHAMKKRWPTPA